MGMQLLIGASDLINHRANLGVLVEYDTVVGLGIPARLREAVHARHAIAIAGPARTTTLASLQLATILPGIDDLDEHTTHPFATSENCHHSWIGLRAPSMVAATLNQPLSQQLGNATVQLLPKAVTLVWAMITWQICRKERLLGQHRVRTSSLLADGRRIVVGQAYRNAPIAITAARDDQYFPDLGVIKLFSG